MKQVFKKFRFQGGFTLTEVMIGIMILTIAIVSASNLLVGLIKTNKLNTQTLQAYYFAQEGIELVRNIRDTNWLLNVGFSEGGIGQEALGFELRKGKTYAITLNSQGWNNSRKEEGLSFGQLQSYRPWDIASGSQDDFYNEIFALGLNEEDISDGTFYKRGSVDSAVFFRHIDISGVPCGEDLAVSEKACSDFVLVKSIVNWKDGGNEREVALEAVLSNWKGGAL